jgi:TonB family protein
MKSVIFNFLILLCTTLTVFTSSGQNPQSSVPDAPSATWELQEWRETYATTFQEEIKNLESQIRSNSRESSLHYQLGVTLMGLRQSEKAFAEFKKAIRLDNKHALAWHRMGQILLEQVQYEDSIKCFQEAFKRQPNNIQPQLEIIQVLILQRNFSDALATINRTIRCFPDSLQAHSRLADFYTRISPPDPDSAIKTYQEILTRWPDAAEERASLALLYQQNHRAQDAVAESEKLAANDLQSVSVARDLIYIYCQNKQFDKALSAIQKLRATRPGHKSMASFFIDAGMTTQFAGEFETALNIFQETLKLDPENTDGLYLSGRLLARMGKIKEAEGAKESLKKIDRDLAKRLGEEISKPGKLEILKAQDGSPISEVTKMPQLIHFEKIHITDAARADRAQGVIVVSVLISTEGEVIHARIIRGASYGMNEEAIRAARKCRFRPAEKNGVPVLTRKSLVYSFSVQ